jgi:hypothetical protein
LAAGEKGSEGALALSQSLQGLFDLVQLVLEGGRQRTTGRVGFLQERADVLEREAAGFESQEGS